MNTYLSGELPQVGDVVFCVNPDWGLESKEYIVKKVIDFLDEITLVDAPEGSGSFYYHRFRLVKRASQEKSTNQVKLHLGCNLKKIHGFTNVDIRPEVNPDLVDDCAKLEKIENESVDVIYTCHMLEHLKREESKQALNRYWEVLKNGGEIYISVPDIEMICRHYVLYRDLHILERLLYGGQTHVADFHFTGWDFDTLKEDLSNLDFHSIYRYDPWKTDWSYHDDYSKAYLPHMDFAKGTLMSLNVKAKK